jgi:hypothetical protein
MRKCIFVIIISTFIITGIYAQKDFDFKPHTVFILSVESHQLDLVYLLGTNKSDEEIAVTVGRKGLKSGNFTDMEMALSLDGNELKSVDEILISLKSSWYKIKPFLEDYRDTKEGLFSILHKNYGIEKYTSATEIETILPVSEKELIWESGSPIE